MLTGWKKLLIFLSLSIFLVLGFLLNETRFKSDQPKEVQSAGYRKNPLVSAAEWDLLHPYFVPETHPIKPRLDQAFSKMQGELSKKSLKMAGFEVVSYGNTTIAKHPDMPGYVIKLYLDNYEMIEAPQFYRRIVGAKRAEEVIAANGFEQAFIVPHKMVYPIYFDQVKARKDIYYQKHFVLVVDALDVLEKEQNEKKYKEELTHEQLEQLFVFLDETGLYDLVYIDNIPFTKDGRFAVLDTEDYDKKYVRFHYFARWLSPESAVYWNELIRQGGPKHSVRPGSPWSSSASYRKGPADLLDMARLKKPPLAE